MKRFVCFFFCFLFAAVALFVGSNGGVFAQSELITIKGERRALLISVSQYADKDFIELPSADNDVKLMKEELLNSGFKQQNIRVLSHNSGTLPTRDNIMEEVKKFVESCGSEDLAFIMVTGRGERDGNTRKDYFIPLDGKASDFNTFVPLDFIVDSLDSSKAKVKWLLADVGRGTSKGAFVREPFGRLEPKSGMLIFQSCSPGEISFCTDDEKYGLFTYCFVEGLRGGAIRDDGRVTVLGAFEYALYKIKDRQHPIMSAKDFDDFVLSDNVRWRQAADHYHKAMQYFEAEDYIQAEKQICLALVFDSPLRDVYQKKADLIAKLLGKVSVEPNSTSKTEKSKIITTETKASDIDRTVPSTRVSDAVPVEESLIDPKVESVTGVRRALLIAVSEYSYRWLSDLPGVENDVKLMREELVKSGFKEKDIQVLSGVRPLGAIILETIEEFTKECKENDLAFILLTGHGLRNPKTNEDFFLPLDAKVTAKDTDFNTFVPIDFVIKSLESSKAKFKWLLVDACRNTSKDAMSGTSFGKLEPQPGMLIFQSSSPNEQSLFTEDEEYSLFIHSFVEGLHGGAIGDDGRVTVKSAFNYASERIKDKQHPVMIPSPDFVDFVLNENEIWVKATVHYGKAKTYYNAGKYEEAQKNMHYALEFAKDTPLHDKYLKKAQELKIDALAEIAKQTNGTAEPSIESESQPQN